MTRGTLLTIAAAFLAGLIFHALYQRWNPAADRAGVSSEITGSKDPNGVISSNNYSVTYAPLPASVSETAEPPLLQAREVDKIRARAGSQARIRGRIFRVGHSAKSNTYFLSFGPSREALTAVIFASAVELFEQKKIPPKGFEGREVELQGEIKDHPQFGLEIIVENPSQLKSLD